VTEPVLSSSWCTAWGSYNTPRLWAMVKDEDDPEAWRQVSAWGEISDAMKDQRALLLKAREALVSAWPPEQNNSAAAFVAEVDKLIGRMDAAKTEADDTATGLANILEALRQAKKNIEPLWEQYKQKSDDLVPAWWDNAEDELDKQAQAHMITAEQVVQDNVARLRVPDPYLLDPIDPHYRRETFSDDDRSGTGSSGSVGVTGSSGGRGGSGSGVSVPVPHDPVPPLPGRDPIVPEGPAGGGSGPGLAEVINPPVVNPGPVNPPGVLPSGGGGGPGIVPPVGPIVGPVGGGVGPLGTGGSPGRGPAGVRGTGVGGIEPGVRATGTGGLGAGGLGSFGPGGPGGIGRGARPGARPGAAGRQALPSGAVIGETVAGEGRGGVGGVGRGGSAGLGGVGGPGGAARGAAGRAPGQRRGTEPVRPPRPSWLPDEPVGTARTAGTGGLPGMPGGARGGRRAGDGEQPAFDPDNPWGVAEGVEPVIAPGTDTTRHDPGPNVIGRHG
jgi:hypothetical protein